MVTEQVLSLMRLTALSLETLRDLSLRMFLARWLSRIGFHCSSFRVDVPDSPMRYGCSWWLYYLLSLPQCTWPSCPLSTGVVICFPWRGQCPYQHALCLPIEQGSWNVLDCLPIPVLAPDSEWLVHLSSKRNRVHARPLLVLTSSCFLQMF